MPTRTRDPRTRRLVIAACTAVLLTLTAAHAALADRDRDERRKQRVELRGRVAGLFPGEQRPLVVTLANRTDRLVRVSRVVVHPSRAAKGCGADQLRARPVRTNVVIEPDRRAAVSVPVRLAPTAPDACQGVTFPLRMRASVRPVRRGAVR
jgi:hypothetical protein